MQGCIPCRNCAGCGFGHNSRATRCLSSLDTVGLPDTRNWMRPTIEKHLQKWTNCLSCHARNEPSSSPSHFPHCKQTKHHCQTSVATRRPPHSDHAWPPSLCEDQENGKWKRNLMAIVNSLHHGIATVFAASNECHHLHRRRHFHDLVVLHLRAALTGQTEKQQQ